MVLNINLICDSPPPPPPNATTCLKNCLATNNVTKCDCSCFCSTCKGACGDGCYDKCHKKPGCEQDCKHVGFDGDGDGTGDAARYLASNYIRAQDAPPSNDSHYYSTEAPAPKAGIRVGNHKLLVECFNASSQSIQGRVMLYDLGADPSESTNIAQDNPDIVAKLSARIVFYGVQAAVPMGDQPPWQGAEYYCAACAPGQAPQ